MMTTLQVGQYPALNEPRFKELGEKDKHASEVQRVKSEKEERRKEDAASERGGKEERKQR